MKTNYILADIYDLIAAFHWAYIRSHGGKMKRPQPYPRPHDKERRTQRYGKGAMKLNDLKKFLFRKKE